MPLPQTSIYHNWKKMPGEHPRGDKLQAGFFIGFLVVWTTDYLLHGTTWLNHVFRINYRLPVGIFMILLSYYILRRSEADLFHRPGHYNTPVHHGIYQHCRHPMYLGVLLFHCGLGICSMSLLSWGVIGISFFLYARLSRFEEQALIRKYGEKYRLYMKIVPRWIPKLHYLISHPLNEVELYQE